MLTLSQHRKDPRNASNPDSPSCPSRSAPGSGHVVPVGHLHQRGPRRRDNVAAKRDRHHQRDGQRPANCQVARRTRFFGQSQQLEQICRIQRFERSAVFRLSGLQPAQQRAGRHHQRHADHRQLSGAERCRPNLDLAALRLDQGRLRQHRHERWRAIVGRVEAAAIQRAGRIRQLHPQRRPPAAAIGRQQQRRCRRHRF